MTHRMGRLTKRNRAKYRRRAYAAGMLRADESTLQTLPVEERGRLTASAPVGARRRTDRHEFDDKRAA